MMSLPRLSLALALFAGLTLFALPAMAQDFSECAGIEDNDARLACFDRKLAEARAADAAAPVETRPEARPSTPAATPPAAPTREARERRFGLPNIFNRDRDPLTAEQYPPAPEDPRSDPDVVTEISSRVVKLDYVGYGDMRFTLENGQVWEQVGRGKIRPGTGEGDMAFIRRSFTGTHFLRLNNEGSAVRVKRTR